jgi:hypothetical protein
MRGEFTGDYDIQIMFGNPNDGATSCSSARHRNSSPSS